MAFGTLKQFSVLSSRVGDMIGCPLVMAKIEAKFATRRVGSALICQSINGANLRDFVVH